MTLARVRKPVDLGKKMKEVLIFGTFEEESQISLKNEFFFLVETD